jgi:transcriptional regulatory protein LevR
MGKRALVLGCATGIGNAAYLTGHALVAHGGEALPG